QKMAVKLSREILKLKPNKKAIVIGLIGELGSGKTVFTKGFAEGLGLKKIITSPTFVLMRIYPLPVTRYSRLIHIDAYRLEKSKDLIDLGFKNLIHDPKNIILIEWADRIKNILPKNCLRIKFEHIDKNKRKIWINRRIK
ncbi:MAG: tRNA (adenosine(37)-N6)-threonylcarbamoyltransferase complex ATPase subunit type 1 TsaE, partial [Candidatus Tagabacteria bacterium]